MTLTIPMIGIVAVDYPTIQEILWKTFGVAFIGVLLLGIYILWVKL